MIPLQSGVQSRVAVFEEIFLVFLGLGTLVGIVVVAYVLYNVYKYRHDGAEDRDEDRPSVGELPTGGGSGRKLFVSFGLSAIIVISLIVWTYGLLLYVEDGPDANEPDEEALEIDVEGFAFGWTFIYDDGQGGEFESSGEMVVPEDTTVWLTVTSTDVWHSFGAPELRVKADAIPNEYDRTWFQTPALDGGEEEQYRIECFELCGEGHSQMEADLVVVPQEEYEGWVDEQASGDGGENGGGGDGGNETAGNETAGNETAGGNETDGGNETADGGEN
ncbi:cytochrome c oxidase subunit II [Salinilacihabitans rarus]|uniref:cytochrome c oxidase subunit II n=1 Tax=Salinilacihabitans rarus TaxID=2961596 RepID=UPI0020C85328|nr:cytochrome c oxidase subunit II [Salinilacihabitans rarus]